VVEEAGVGDKGGGGGEGRGVGGGGCHGHNVGLYAWTAHGVVRDRCMRCEAVGMFSR